MPYRWSVYNKDHKETQILELWPHNSLSKNGFATFIIITFILTLFPLIALSGTILFWWLLPFMMLALWTIWVALRQSYKNNEIFERLSFDTEMLKLIQTTSSGKNKSWSCAGYWSRVNLYTSEGPIPFYVTLKGNGREVEIGAFLSEGERKSLYHELLKNLVRYRI